MRSTASTTIDVPVDTVWSVLADHEGMANWGPGLSVSLTRAGEGDANGVGAIRRLKAPGPMPAIVEEITAFEAPTRLGYRALSGVPLRNYTGEVVLSAANGGTRIDYTVSADRRVPLVEGVAVAAIARGLLFALTRAARAAA